jgi:hypothetical protein
VGGRVLDDASRAAMFRAQTASGYGYGWTIGVARGHRIATHEGGINGFSACARVYPDDDVYVLALSNLANQPLCTAIVAPLGDLAWRN